MQNLLIHYEKVLSSHLSVLFVRLGPQFTQESAEAMTVWGTNAVQAGGQQHHWSWRQQQCQWALYQTKRKKTQKIIFLNMNKLTNNQHYKDQVSPVGPALTISEELQLLR